MTRLEAQCCVLIFLPTRETDMLFTQSVKEYFIILNWQLLLQNCLDAHFMIACKLHNYCLANVLDFSFFRELLACLIPLTPFKTCLDKGFRLILHINCDREQTTIITKSSWLNCALRGDEALFRTANGW